MTMVSLRAFKDHPAAALMLHLARGQLNRACRLHGLQPPNPVSGDERLWTEGLDPADMPPAGAEPLAPLCADAFARWEAEMPADLIAPILLILRETRRALTSRAGSEATRDAAEVAADLLRAIAASQCGSSGLQETLH